MRHETGYQGIEIREKVGARSRHRDWLLLMVSFRQKVPVPLVLRKGTCPPLEKGTVSFLNDRKQTVPNGGPLFLSLAGEFPAHPVQKAVVRFPFHFLERVDADARLCLVRIREHAGPVVILSLDGGSEQVFQDPGYLRLVRGFPCCRRCAELSTGANKCRVCNSLHTRI
jgi:hypothetical protein